MKRALIGAAYLISGPILICAANIALTNDDSRIVMMLGLSFVVIGIIVTLVELFRGDNK